MTVSNRSRKRCTVSRIDLHAKPARSKRNPKIWTTRQRHDGHHKPTPAQSHEQPRKQELALWWSLTLETRSHWWVKAGHPRYTSAVDGSTVHSPRAHTAAQLHKNRLHQLSSKVLKGIFIGHALNAGGSWTGVLLVADVEASNNNAAGEVYVKRFREKDVGIQKWQNN